MLDDYLITYDEKEPEKGAKAIRRSINIGQVIGSTGLVSQFMIDEQLLQKIRADKRLHKQYSSITVVSANGKLIPIDKIEEDVQGEQMETSTGLLI